MLVKDATEVEKALHFAFGDGRIDPNRELDPDVEAADKQSAQNLKNTKRPRQNFHELDILNGSILVQKPGECKLEAD